MTNSFLDYSKYYDLLYSDKNYRDEVGYIKNLINEYSAKEVHSVLELGCGTGIHGELMASEGLVVHGIDLSPDMLEVARSRSITSSANTGRFTFEQGDVRSFRTAKRFDVVTSLFHVLSYQNQEADLHAMMQTANVHLEAGGLFIFDFWYGPAVLWQRPLLRSKRFSNEHLNITRIATPVVRDAENVVDVNYVVFINDRKNIFEINEVHSMRYFFLPEIYRLLGENGFRNIKAEEWLTRKEPSLDTWGVCVIAQKI